MRYDNEVSTYHLENFGCRATQADGAAIERQFEARGLARSTAANADLIILNTCTVTDSADRDARAAVRRVRRENPLAKIIVTGCYAQRVPEEVAALPGVNVVIGNSHKHRLAEIALPGLTANTELVSASGDEVSNLYQKDRAFLPLSSLTANRELRTEARVFVSDIFADVSADDFSDVFGHTELLAAPVFESGGEFAEHARTRPNLKVQDGCDNRCSFCVIPSVRGHSRSLSLPEVIREVNTLVTAGYRELVISGINLGRWGREPGFHLPSAGSRISATGQGIRKPDFGFLLHTILAETQLEKLRISSVEPMDWTDDLIAFVASTPRIAKHAHVPLQSGSDAVLRRMHRKYRPWHYREKIEKIRAAMPAAAIGADVMTGFPGESEAEFEATRRLIEELPFTYLHVFTYSPRPGTPAAAMPNQVPVQVARERNKILRDLAAEKKHAFARSFVGKPVEAITLNVVHDGPDGEFTEALTDNYQKLYLTGRQVANRWISARVESVKEGGLFGVVAGTNLF